MTSAQGKRQPDQEGTSPLPGPRRHPSNQRRSTRRDAARLWKEEQTDTTSMQSKERQKATEDAAARLAQRESLEDLPVEQMLVAKQSQLIEDYANRENARGSGRETTAAPATTTTTTTSSSQSTQETAVPGAFRMRPCRGATPAVGLEEGERDDHDPLSPQESRRELTEKEDTTMRDGEDVLIEAELVADTELPSSSFSSNSTRQQQPIYPEPELIMGEPMKKPSMEGDENKSRARRLRWIMGAVVLFATVSLVVTVVVVVVLGGVGQDNNKKNTKEEQSGAVLILSNGEGATMAPTPFTPDLLPTYTQQSMNDSSESPQSQAYEWIVQDLETISLDAEAFFSLQRFALATLYYATQGVSWTKSDQWLQSGTDPCEWYSSSYGSTCSIGEQRRNLRSLQKQSSRRYYERLSLFQNNLVGTLPPELGLLTMLDVADLHGNEISGVLPSELGQWTRVTYLQLHNNALTGTLPKELGQLSQIRHLNFAYNQLSGPIPTELSLLSSTIQVFSVSNNRVKGTIPSELALMAGLEGLHLYNNPNLGGTIPSEFGRLNRLVKLHLNGIDLLSGTIPSELGALAEAQEIQLHGTQLQGTIPSTLGSLSQLSKLTLHNTKLTGNVPEEICSLVEAGILHTLSVDCDVMQCPRNCDCDCDYEAPLRYEAGASTSSQPVVVEAVTDPPVVVSSPADDPSTPRPGDHQRKLVL